MTEKALAELEWLMTEMLAWAEARGEELYQLRAEMARLREGCQYALSYFEHTWKEMNEHPASHYADYVDELRAALSDTADDKEMEE